MRFAIDMTDMMREESMVVIRRHNGTCAVDAIGNFVGLFDDQDDAGMAQQDVLRSVEAKNKGIWKQRG
jgi:hypothetical protein